MFSQPLREYALLKITRVLESGEPDQPVPFILRRLVSREYHIGPEGATIGSSPEATIFLPRETGMCGRHVEIKWISGEYSKYVQNHGVSRFVCFFKCNRNSIQLKSLVYSHYLCVHLNNEFPFCLFSKSVFFYFLEQTVTTVCMTKKCFCRTRSAHVFKQLFFWAGESCV